LAPPAHLHVIWGLPESVPEPTLAAQGRRTDVKPTNTGDPAYYLKVVDCQYACPSHTPVPEYIRLIAHRRFDDAYLVNWESNVFPGILGRTCDRPCEPACRRGRVEDEPVAICRLKRAAADFKSDITPRLPGAGPPNGKKVALIGAGPSALTVVRDLAPLGYELHLYDALAKGGGFMRSQIPAFRLPESVLDEEVGYVLNMGVTTRFDTYVGSLKSILDQGYDAVYVGTGAPRGRDLPKLPGRKDAAGNIHIGIDWLASVAFGHTDAIGRRVIVLGGGNTAMDCSRTARRLGGEDVKVIVRSPFDDMKASPWEKEDAIHEGIPILDNHVPLEFVAGDGRLTGMTFETVRAVYSSGGRRELVPTGAAPVFVPCDDVLIAIGQENAFPWIERSVGVDFNGHSLPVIDPVTLQSTRPGVFFGGDAAKGPKNIITSVAHGHQAAISIDLHCQGRSLRDRPPPHVNLVSQKMGLHEWSYDSAPSNDARETVPLVDLGAALTQRTLEVELGFDFAAAFREAQRCLNCDVQTVFAPEVCIECDACADVCPTSCITFTANGTEDDLRARLAAPATNTGQDLLVSTTLGTGRVMVKDEDVCLHCGLCAERCPTGAWDMQRFRIDIARASPEMMVVA
jgi:NADPH-dependent glutamate synthase beta subunit-like oxidoreductase